MWRCWPLRSPAHQRYPHSNRKFRTLAFTTTIDICARGVSLPSQLRNTRKTAKRALARIFKNHRLDGVYPLQDDSDSTQLAAPSLRPNRRVTPYSNSLLSSTFSPTHPDVTILSVTSLVTLMLSDICGRFGEQDSVGGPGEWYIAFHSILLQYLLNSLLYFNSTVLRFNSTFGLIRLSPDLDFFINFHVDGLFLYFYFNLFNRLCEIHGCDCIALTWLTTVGVLVLDLKRAWVDLVQAFGCTRWFARHRNYAGPNYASLDIASSELQPQCRNYAALASVLAFVESLSWPDTEIMPVYYQLHPQHRNYAGVVSGHNYARMNRARGRPKRSKSGVRFQLANQTEMKQA
ncbi:hypothetical protein R3P38DRAFT_3371087 [Favolaschia claudopus]|uniref:Uncharacterized protein n=1 Tax=Favolaschia claudopus TaxID=2862362 RepID=A0AAV9ZZD6_9AGAR